MNRLQSVLALGLAVAALLVATTGCGGGGQGGSQTPDPRIRFINASSDAGSLRLQYDNDVLANNLAFGVLTPNWVSVEPRDYDVQTFATDDGEALWAEVNAFQLDKSYIAVSYGIRNFGSETLKRVRTTHVDVDVNADSNAATLIVFNALNSAAGFDTTAIRFQNDDPSKDNPTYSLDNIGYGSSSTLRNVEPNTPIDFLVRRQGSEFEYATATQTLTAGGIYLVLVTGVEDGTGDAVPAIRFYKLN